jgi:hypothetical protein
LNKSLPSPKTVAVVALVALVLGVFGATSSSYAAGLTKGAVKKIAAKVVDKKAPGLSVGKAKTADTATNATNATNAANAGNSAQLGGAAPATYLDRIVHDNVTANTAVNGGGAVQIMNAAVITVPDGVGFIHATGVASFSTGNTNVQVWPSFDSICVAAGDNYEHRNLGNTTQQTSVAVDLVVPVTAGNHSVRLCALSGADTSVGTRSLTVQTVAADFNG